MITVPIVLDFQDIEANDNHIIGILHVDETRLPITPNYSFNLGYVLNVDGTYKLICVSPIMYKDTNKE